jgi:hypothetical protein
MNTSSLVSPLFSDLENNSLRMGWEDGNSIASEAAVVRENKFCAERQVSPGEK